MLEQQHHVNLDVKLSPCGFEGRPVAAQLLPDKPGVAQTQHLVISEDANGIIIDRIASNSNISNKYS